MKLNRTPSLHDRKWRNEENDNWNKIEKETSLLKGIGKYAVNTLAEALKINAEAKRVNDENENVQQQINTLIAESGTSDAEVVQARTDLNGSTHTVLKERLDVADDALADTERVINVKHHGAKGDGVTDDYFSIQGAIILAETTGKSVYLPSGTYYVSQTLRTQHQVSYNYRIGIRIFGNGKDTVLMGARDMTAADYAQELSAQSLLAVHGANNIVENIAFEGGKVGIFLGQDPSQTAGSSASMNIFDNLWFYYNGTGIILQHGSGVHYNKFKNMHIAHAQIGIHLERGQLDRVNNNRNVFENIRVSRAWIGYLIQDGDGNFFNKVYAETIRAGQTIGERPAQLPSELGDKHCAIVITGGQYNFFNQFSNEAVDFDIFDSGYRNDFVFGMLKDDTAETANVMFPTNNSPRYYMGNSRRLTGMGYQSTPNILYPGSPGGNIVTMPIFDEKQHKQLVDLMPLCPQITSKHSYSRSIYYRLGGFVDWHTAYRFQVNVGEEDTPLKINIPNENTLERVMTRGLTGNSTMPFKAVVGRGIPYQNEVFARFSTDNEAAAHGSPHIIVPAPTEGWTSDGQNSYLYFQVRFSNY